MAEGKGEADEAVNTGKVDQYLLGHGKDQFMGQQVEWMQINGQHNADWRFMHVREELDKCVSG